MAQGAAWALAPPPRHAEAINPPSLPVGAQSPAGASDVTLPWLTQLNGQVLLHAARVAAAQNARDLHEGRARLEAAAGPAALFEDPAPPSEPARPLVPVLPCSPPGSGHAGKRSVWGKRALAPVKTAAEAEAEALSARRAAAGLARTRGFYGQLATTVSLRPRGKMLVEKSVSVAMVGFEG